MEVFFINLRNFHPSKESSFHQNSYGEKSLICLLDAREPTRFVTQACLLYVMCYVHWSMSILIHIEFTMSLRRRGLNCSIHMDYLQCCELWKLLWKWRSSKGQKSKEAWGKKNFFFRNCEFANCNFVSNIISVQKLTIARLHLAIEKVWISRYKLKIARN